MSKLFITSIFNVRMWDENEETSVGNKSAFSWSDLTQESSGEQSGRDMG